jgi:hypothetical protein
MKKFLFTLVTFIACLCTASLAIAQAQEASPQSGQDRAQGLAQVLNLSPQQESQLAPILRAEKPKVHAIMEDPNLSPSEKKSKLQQVHSQTDPVVKSILNPTQYKQWQTIRNDELENVHMR